MARTVVFFHPDLGIGGAERLVVDAAVVLQKRGYQVVIYTSHCDPTHCFDEARDGTLDVRVRGNLLPPTFLGKFKILLTILRHYHLLLQIILSGELARLQPSAFFADQLSAGLPILRWVYPDIRILFYCHYPDLLLVQGRKSLLKRIWRYSFDAVEGWSMRRADRVVVNSKYTRSVVNGVWSDLGGTRGIGVVYPCVDTSEPEVPSRGAEKPLWPDKKLILSINRFERKKDIALAIRAFAKLDPATRKKAKLVIAGGYDPREQENVGYHEELGRLATSLGLKHATANNIATALGIPGDMDVLFLLSVPAQLKAMLLASAKLLVYTPTNEHFGIVPIEAMLAGVPVLATSTGGPLETVVESETGWLRSPDKVDDWKIVMHNVIDTISADQLKKMGEAGKRRVRNIFSSDEMGETLDDEIRKMRASPRVDVMEMQDLLLTVGAGAMVLIAIAVIAFKLVTIEQ